MTTHRSFFTKQRRQLSDQQRHTLARHASLHLPKLLSLLPKGANIALYYDEFGELPTAPILRFCQRYGFFAHLPVVWGDTLKFAPIYPKNSLPFHATYAFFNLAHKRHRLGMIEPVARQLRPAWQMTAIFCPLVAVDRQGVRLGMGGGFYDRTLSHTKALKIGWCYDFQLTDQLPKHPWDIAMDIVITPSHFLRLT
ncbi:MAG: 5-formyltetrahydrofolate cyclo-ligase [Moraxella sp.]|nr:5-formyltetrahydrofolate cyclo-ligase [Moraxella sp.]